VLGTAGVEHDSSGASSEMTFSITFLAHVVEHDAVYRSRVAVALILGTEVADVTGRNDWTFGELFLSKLLSSRAHLHSGAPSHLKMGKPCEPESFGSLVGIVLL
jgi:hypothetical protein